MKRAKQVLLLLMAVTYMGAGANHFINTDFYLAMMPPYVPFHEVMVYLSGLIEILLGVAVLIPKVRRLAGFGVIALLIAVFPANLHMALHPEDFGAEPLGLYVRLPIQLVLIAWAWWVTKPNPPPPTEPA